MHCCEEYLIKPIISLVQSRIDKEAKTVCYGCLYDRPGQRDHDKCLMLDPIEKLEEFFEIAWEKCQFAEILKPLIYEYMKVTIAFFLPSSTSYYSLYYSLTVIGGMGK